MKDLQDPIMTLSDMAAYLKLAEKTVLRLVHRRELPCFKVASQWRFRRSDIDEWIMTNIQNIHSSDLARLIHSDRDRVSLSRMTGEEFILPDIRSGTKEEVSRQLIQPLVRKGIVDDEDTFLEKLMGRENMSSTAVGKSVALPHLRHSRDNPPGGPFLIIGVCSEGTDFASLDGEPTRLFVMLCADSETVHLRIMAGIILLLRRKDTIKKIISTSTKNAILNLIIEEESRMIFNPDPEEGGSL